MDCFTQIPFERNAQRLLQSTFRDCEYFARGMAEAGCFVTSMNCNKAGNIQDLHWDIHLENAPFRESLQPVYHKV